MISCEYQLWNKLPDPTPNKLPFFFNVSALSILGVDAETIRQLQKAKRKLNQTLENNFISVWLRLFKSNEDREKDLILELGASVSPQLKTIEPSHIEFFLKKAFTDHNERISEALSDKSWDAEPPLEQCESDLLNCLRLWGKTQTYRKHYQEKLDDVLKTSFQNLIWKNRLGENKEFLTIEE